MDAVVGPFLVGNRSHARDSRENSLQAPQASFSVSPDTYTPFQVNTAYDKARRTISRFYKIHAEIQKIENGIYPGQPPQTVLHLRDQPQPFYQVGQNRMELYWDPHKGHITPGGSICFPEQYLVNLFHFARLAYQANSNHEDLQAFRQTRTQLEQIRQSLNTTASFPIEQFNSSSWKINSERFQELKNQATHKQILAELKKLHSLPAQERRAHYDATLHTASTLPSVRKIDVSAHILQATEALPKSERADAQRAAMDLRADAAKREFSYVRQHSVAPKTSRQPIDPALDVPFEKNSVIVQRDTVETTKESPIGGALLQAMRGNTYRLERNSAASPTHRKFHYVPVPSHGMPQQPSSPSPSQSSQRQLSPEDHSASYHDSSIQSWALIRSSSPSSEEALSEQRTPRSALDLQHSPDGPPFWNGAWI